MALTFSIPGVQAVKIALELKKALVDQNRLNVTQAGGAYAAGASSKVWAVRTCFAHIAVLINK